VFDPLGQRISQSTHGAYGNTSEKRRWPPAWPISSTIGCAFAKSAALVVMSAFPSDAACEAVAASAGGRPAPLYLLFRARRLASVAPSRHGTLSLVNLFNRSFSSCLARRSPCLRRP